MALTKREANRLEKVKAYSRPTFMYVATASLAMIVLTICYLLIRELTTMSEVAALLMAIVPALATPIAVLIGGRSWEKTKQSAQYPTDQIVEDIPPMPINADGESLD